MPSLQRPSGVTLECVQRLSTLEPEWRALEQRADASLFTSWTWIGTWLDLLPFAVRPLLLRYQSEGKTRALAVLVPRWELRVGCLPTRVLHTHATGQTHLDELTVEYNDLLVERGFEGEARRACLEYFSTNRGYHEWRFDGTVARGFEDAARQAGLRYVVETKKSCYSVDLDRIRQSDKAYLSHLSSNTRHNIRRSIKEYEKTGPVELYEPRSVKEAQEFLAKLSRLHQAYWTRRGLPGSFSNRFFSHFHFHFVAKHFSQGRVQLLRLSAGDEEVGYLYNFVFDGVVLNYQSGLNYELCKGPNRPGFVAHALAIQRNLEAGRRVYDFLAGDDAYKKSMSNKRTEMQWAVLERDDLRSEVGRQARALAGRVRTAGRRYFGGSSGTPDGVASVVER